MADPSKQYPPGYNPSGGINPRVAGPLREAVVVDEFLRSFLPETNRQIYPGIPIVPGSFDHRKPFSPLLPSPTPIAPPKPIDYIPPPVIPAARTGVGTPSVSVDTPTAIADKVPFPFDKLTSKAEAAGGTLGITAIDVLSKKLLGTQLVTQTGTPLLTKLALGLPAGVVGSMIAGGQTLGANEERDIALQAEASSVGKQLAVGQAARLAPPEVAAVQSLFQSDPKVGAAIITSFNQTADENARLLAAGLAVEAARGIAVGDLTAVAGAPAVARREQFVSGLLGLILPNYNVAGVTLFAPQLTRGDP